MVVWLSLFFFGVAALGACWIAFEAVQISASWAENFFGFLAIVAIVCIFFGLLGGMAQDEKDTKRKDDRQNDAVMRACYPKVATNRNEGDSRITFDCANDGKLRVVKK